MFEVLNVEPCAYECEEPAYWEEMFNAWLCEDCHSDAVYMATCDDCGVMDSLVKRGWLGHGAYWECQSCGHIWH